VTDDEVLVRVETLRVAGKHGRLPTTDGEMADSLALILKAAQVRIDRRVRSSRGMDQAEAARLLSWMRLATLEATGRVL
jgi:hypothetical protein